MGSKKHQNNFEELFGSALLSQMMTKTNKVSTCSSFCLPLTNLWFSQSHGYSPLSLIPVVTQEITFGSSVACRDFEIFDRCARLPMSSFDLVYYNFHMIKTVLRMKLPIFYPCPSSHLKGSEQGLRVLFRIQCLGGFSDPRGSKNCSWPIWSIEYWRTLHEPLWFLVQRDLQTSDFSLKIWRDSPEAWEHHRLKYCTKKPLIFGRRFLDRHPFWVRLFLNPLSSLSPGCPGPNVTAAGT